MDLGVWFVAVIVLVLTSPLIWGAWWLLADLGEARARRTAHTAGGIPMRRHQPAA